MEENKEDSIYSDQSVIKVASLLGFSILIGALLVLFGWYYDITFLKSFVPGLSPMNPMSAVCFLGVGLSIFLLGYSKDKRLKWLARFMALIPLIVGFFDLLGYFEKKISVDILLFTNKLGDPGRMAYTSAFCFVLIALTIFLIDFRTKKNRWPAHVFLIVCLLVSLTMFLSYIYGTNYNYQLFYLKPMSLPTSLLLTMAGVALFLVRPDNGFVKMFFKKGTGGSLTRRIFWALIIGVPLLGYLVDVGTAKKAYDYNFGQVIIIVVSVLILQILVWKSSYNIDIEENKNRLLNKNLEDEAEFKKNLVETSPFGLIVYNVKSGKCISANEEAARQLGATMDQLLKQNFREISSWKKSGIIEYAQNAISSEKPQTAETHLITTFGKDIYSFFTFSTFKKGDEKFLMVTFQDITDRKIIEEQLNKRLEELEKINKLIVGRELKMIELKNEMEALKEDQNKNKK